LTSPCQVLHRPHCDGDEPAAVANQVGQIWAFRERIQPGDLIALPLKTRAAIAIGRIKGPYQYRLDLPGDTRHVRAADWLRMDIPRSAFAQDLLFSLGAFMTVCRIQRNNAEERIKAVLDGHARPNAAREPDVQEKVEAEVVAPVDLEEYAHDLIRDFIGQKFKGHNLERLVAAVLKAEGYQTQQAPAGADGGSTSLLGEVRWDSSRHGSACR
jgi:restriction system protein